MGPHPGYRQSASCRWTPYLDWTVGPQPAGLQVILGAPLSPQPTTCRTVTKPWIEIPDVSSSNASLLEFPVLEPPGTSVQVDPSKQLATLRSQLDPSELFGELHRIAASLTRQIESSPAILPGRRIP